VFIILSRNSEIRLFGVAHIEPHDCLSPCRGAARSRSRIGSSNSVALQGTIGLVDRAIERLLRGSATERTKRMGLRPSTIRPSAAMTCRWRCRPNLSLWTALDDRFAASNLKPTLPRLGHKRVQSLVLQSSRPRKPKGRRVMEQVSIPPSADRRESRWPQLFGSRRSQATQPEQTDDAGGGDVDLGQRGRRAAGRQSNALGRIEHAGTRIQQARRPRPLLHFRASVSNSSRLRDRSRQSRESEVARIAPQWHRGARRIRRED